MSGFRRRTGGARPRRRALGAAAAAGLALMLVTCGRAEAPGEARLSLTATLGGGDTVGYARALEPRPFDFPRDHGPHPGFRSEWWYVTGNLTGEDGRRVGFQLTLFRSALAPTRTPSSSEWTTNQAYMAHFALTDVDGHAFHAVQRFERGAVGLAGARAEPFRAWVGDWFLASVDSVPGAGTFPLRLRAFDDTVGVDLRLERGKPVVLQGDRGLSRKGPEPGNASYYYSYTRMPAAGSVRLGEDTLRVTGLAWLDREWSTSALSPGVAGWDWFALQLDDGVDLMVYRLRAEAGDATPWSQGVLVDADGASHRLAWGRDVQVEATGTWTSGDGAVYPSGWRVRVPGAGLDLDVEPVLRDQELDLAFRYWEGAVRVAPHGATGAAGRGYVELTGYAGARSR